MLTRALSQRKGRVGESQIALHFWTVWLNLESLGIIRLVMWEEHPDYQKAQAKMIGIGLFLLFIVGIVRCVAERDWDLLRQLLFFSGALVFCLALLSGTAWLVVRVLRWRRAGRGSVPDR